MKEQKSNGKTYDLLTCGQESGKIRECSVLRRGDEDTVRSSSFFESTEHHTVASDFATVPVTYALFGE